MTTRKIKIYKQSSGTSYRQVPTIIIKGQWLKDAGFVSGEYVEVECVDDKITLTKTTPPEAPRKSLEEKINGFIFPVYTF